MSKSRLWGGNVWFLFFFSGEVPKRVVTQRKDVAPVKIVLCVLGPRHLWILRKREWTLDKPKSPFALFVLQDFHLDSFTESCLIGRLIPVGINLCGGQVTASLFSLFKHTNFSFKYIYFDWVYVRWVFFKLTGTVNRVPLWDILPTLECLPVSPQEVFLSLNVFLQLWSTI